MKAKRITAVLIIVSIISGVMAGNVFAAPDEWIPSKGPYLAPDGTDAEAVQNRQTGVGESGSYKVQKGDTLHLISKRFGIPLGELASLNNLNNIDNIMEGQVILVPGVNSVYTVALGDNLSCIAQKTGVSVKDISQTNGLRDEDFLVAGQKLVIPGVRGNREGLSPGVGSRSLPVGEMEWPVVGWISSPYGFRDGKPHEGIDIAADYGMPIKAAMEGRVVFAGSRGTYGLAVIIDHGEGLQTLYAHSSRLLVSEGEWINKGQVIALVGNTGRSRGPHLHMEVLINGLPYDPMICFNRGRA